MKATMINLTPRECANLMNGDLSVLVRKKFPKGFIGWCYVHCGKGKPSANIWRAIGIKENVYKAILSLNECQAERDLDNFMNDEFVNKYPQYRGKRITFRPTNLNGKVVARFWCDKVGEIHYVAASFTSKRIVDWNCNEIFAFEEHACLTQEDLDKYLGRVEHSPQGYAIHVAKLEIFDQPKEISEFYKVGYENEKQKIKPNSKLPLFGEVALNHIESEYQLIQAPKTYYYIEI